MKKILVYSALLMMTACGGRSQNDEAKMREILETISQEETTVSQEDTIPKQPTKTITQAEFLKTWKSQGVDNFSFDKDGYLVLQEASSKIQADPDWVAKQYYDLAADVEGIKGCRVVDWANKELGRYEK